MTIFWQWKPPQGANLSMQKLPRDASRSFRQSHSFRKMDRLSPCHQNSASSLHCSTWEAHITTPTSNVVLHNDNESNDSTCEPRHCTDVQGFFLQHEYCNGIPHPEMTKWGQMQQWLHPQCEGISFETKLRACHLNRNRIEAAWTQSVLIQYVQFLFSSSIHGIWSLLISLH